MYNGHKLREKLEKGKRKGLTSNTLTYKIDISNRKTNRALTMQPIRISFKDLHIGAIFTDNGNDYIKKTSRTAYLIKYNKVFYFKASEIVSFTGKYSSLYDARYTVKKEYNGNASPAYITRFCGAYVGSNNSKQAGALLADWHLNNRLCAL